jgi:Bacteriophage lambda head decoration protein D
VTIEGGTGGAGILYPGTMLGQITASLKCVASPNTGSDGSQNATAIIWDYCDATAGDVEAAVVARSAEVRADDLIPSLTN